MSFISTLGLRPYLCFTIEKTFSMCGVQSVEIWRLCDLIFVTVFDFWDSWSNEFLRTYRIFNIVQRFLIFFCRDVFPRTYIQNCIFCHLWELDAASRLNSLASGFPVLDQSLPEGVLSIRWLLDATGFYTVEELVEAVKVRFIVVGFDFVTILSSHSCSCILSVVVFFPCSRSSWNSEHCHDSVFSFLFLHPFRCRFLSVQLVKLNSEHSNVSWNGWCLRDEKDCSTHHMWSSFLSIRVSLLDFCLWHHFKHCFVILKNVQHRAKSIKISVRRDIINITQIKTVVLVWNLGLVLGVLVWCDVTRRVSSYLIFESVGSIWWGMKYFNHQFQRSRAGIPSMRKPASREIISASVELCESEVCFLSIQFFWHERVTSENSQKTSWCWFWVFKIPAKIRVLKQSESTFLFVFPTWLF